MIREVPLEHQLARALPESMALQLHVLPAHQELIAPLPTGYVGPVMAAAEAWLKYHGYRTLGPWMISWGPTGQPQLRRPVSGALKAVRDKDFQTVEVPERLLVAVPFVGWPILPHNFTHAVTAVGLEIMGQPLLLALSNEPPTIAWIPVVPRGTAGLFPRFHDKLGMHPAAPRAGVPLSPRDAWTKALLRLARLITVLSIGAIGLLSLFIVAAMLMGEIPLAVADISQVMLALFLGTVEAITDLYEQFLWWCFLPLMVIFVIQGAFLLSAVGKWNAFWAGRRQPPELLLGSRGEGSVGSWLG